MSRAWFDEYNYRDSLQVRAIEEFGYSVPKLTKHPCDMFVSNFSFFTEAQSSSSWHGQAGSFLGNNPMPFSAAQHSSPPLFDEPTVQEQTEYLRSLTENATAENFHSEALSQSTQLNMSPHQLGRMLEAITQGEEFPGSSTSTSQNSSSGFFGTFTSLEMWPSSSVLTVGDTSVTRGSLGMASSDPSIIVAPTIDQFCHSQHTIVTSAGIITSSKPVTVGGDFSSSSGDRKSTGGINRCSQQGVSNDLAGINPFNAGTEIDIDRYLIPDVEVEFCDLENRVFEKQYSKQDKQARQRIINGKVKFLVRSERQVKNVKAWVRREEKAARLVKDVNGMVAIEAVFLRKHKDSGIVSTKNESRSIFLKISMYFKL